MQEPGDNSLYARLMAIKPRDLSVNAWTLRAGVNRMILNDVKKRGNMAHSSLMKLLDAVGVSLADFEAGEVKVKTEVRGTGMSARDVQAAWHGPQQAKPVPLVGSAFGGEWSDGVEMTELHLAEVLDYLARPQSLSTDPEAYVVEIVGDSMSPRYRPGERAPVSPRAPVRIGDDVIVQLKGDGRDQLADRVTMVLIKELVKRGPTSIHLRQYNPEQTFEVKAERIAAVHRVMGRI